MRVRVVLYASQLVGMKNILLNKRNIQRLPVDPRPPSVLRTAEGWAPRGGSGRGYFPAFIQIRDTLYERSIQEAGSTIGLGFKAVHAVWVSRQYRVLFTGVGFLLW